MRTVVASVCLAAVVVVLYVSHSMVEAIHPDAVNLRDVQALTFREGEYTTGRRSPGVPQLECINYVRCLGALCSRDAARPKVVQCRNVGVDTRGEVQWRCEADLIEGVSFGTTTVNCEGYESSQDENVLRGSCQLEYMLYGPHCKDVSGHSGTHKSEAQATRTKPEQKQQSPPSSTEDSRAKKGSVVLNAIILLLVVATAIFLVSGCKPCENCLKPSSSDKKPFPKAPQSQKDFYEYDSIKTESLPPVQRQQTPFSPRRSSPERKHNRRGSVSSRSSDNVYEHDRVPSQHHRLPPAPMPFAPLPPMPPVPPEPMHYSSPSAYFSPPPVYATRPPPPVYVPLEPVYVSMPQPRPVVIVHAAAVPMASPAAAASASSSPAASGSSSVEPKTRAAVAYAGTKKR